MISENEDDLLAIFGGKPTIKDDFVKYNSIGNEELEAAKKVIESGVLSKYIGWANLEKLK